MCNVYATSGIKVLHKDALPSIRAIQEGRVHLTFLDPPFNQGKRYRVFDDNQPAERYWGWIREICESVYSVTEQGGCIYFMQREKNAEHVLRVLRETGWTFGNLIIWCKSTSATPCPYRFGKSYQIIAFAFKGDRPRVFHRLRIDPPLPPSYKQPRENGIYVTDVWSDIRELTAGYLAGAEALRDQFGRRLHEQQAPVALLLRIILSSTLPNDLVLDPFAGTGTTLVVAEQLGRRAIGIEADERYVSLIHERLSQRRAADDISRWRHYYRYTEGLERIWPVSASAQPSLFDRDLQSNLTEVR